MLRRCVVAVVVLAVLVAVLVLLNLRRPEARVRAHCADQETCTASLDTLHAVDARLQDVLREYRSQYHCPPISFRLLEHPKASYTHEKRTIYLCIRNAAGRLYDHNTLTHVGLHELAHVMCERWDTGREHSAEWTRLFERLLDIAGRRGHYEPGREIDTSYPVDE